MAAHSPNTIGREIHNGAEVPFTLEILKAMPRGEELMGRKDVRNLMTRLPSEKIGGPDDSSIENFGVTQRLRISGLLGDAAQLTVTHTDAAGKVITGMPSWDFTVPHNVLIKAMAA